MSAFEQVYEAFGDFHSCFGPLFGRREARDLSRHYLQALLVQSGERRNAENLSETVPASAGRCSAFSPSPPGTMTRWWGVSKSTWVPAWSIRKPFGCSAAAIFPSRGENRWELPGSTAADWARWPTARQGCSWRMSVPRAGHWWTNGCTSRRAGPRTRNDARRRKPGEIHWAVCRRNLDGSESRYYLSNATEDTPLETLAYVGGSRWRIETEFETDKSGVGLDEYETSSWAGWHHHITLCLLAGVFC